MDSAYSLADIRAVTEGEDRDTWGANGFLWVILIFLFFLAFSGGFGNGFGANGNGGLAQVERDVLTTSCGTQKEVLQNRYDNALQTQTLSAQMAQCCCDLRAEGLANTQRILDKMCENEINQLRTDLQSAQLQISQISQTSNIVNAIRPTPIPAYITCSPYQSVYGFGCGGFGNGFGGCGGCGCGNI